MVAAGLADVLQLQVGGVAEAQLGPLGPHPGIVEIGPDHRQVRRVEEEVALGRDAGQVLVALDGQYLHPGLVAQAHLGQDQADALGGVPFPPGQDPAVLHDGVGQELPADGLGPRPLQARRGEEVEPGDVDGLALAQGPAQDVAHRLPGGGALVVAHPGAQPHPEGPVEAGQHQGRQGGEG